MNPVVCSILGCLFRFAFCRLLFLLLSCFMRWRAWRIDPAMGKLPVISDPRLFHQFELPSQASAKYLSKAFIVPPNFAQPLIVMCLTGRSCKVQQQPRRIR